MSQELKATALKAGIAETLVEQLIAEFGPKLAQILIQWLISKQSQGLKLDLSGLSGVKALLVQLLKEYRDAVLGLADEELAKAYDLVVSKLS